ncbi:hypothetical protein GQ600_401 [Phytophthora cactorum]|nr:hypothetical protein GQ600_401 [Phytophthora cactorum]
MMLARRLQQLRTLSAGPKTSAGSIIKLPTARNMSGKGDSEDWNNLGTVLKQELRNISRENGLEGKMPDTKLLKDLGYGNMGVVEVAANMGTRKDDQVVDVHKKVSARAKRRHNDEERLNKHDFY